MKLPTIFLNLSLGTYIPRNFGREKEGKRRREKEGNQCDIVVFSVCVCVIFVQSLSSS